MLTSRYMTSVKNLSAIMKKIVDGVAPDKFTQAHLKGIGFKSSNDFGIVALLKDLGFLTAEGAPTQRYHDYRNKSRSRAVLGEALREAYEDLFHINENITENDKSAVEGKFKSTHNVSDRVAEEQARTFFSLLELADISNSTKKTKDKDKDEDDDDDKDGDKDKDETKKKKKTDEGNVNFGAFGGLRYNIEIHLPPTKDVEVYNAIFKSLKEHLLDT